MPETNNGALHGIRLIDFGQYLAAPLAALLLAENGADVIRVDPPGGPVWNHPSNAALQRSKRSVVLNLVDAADLAVARDLIRGADVLIEGFRPGVMARLGLSPEAAIVENERLIWCSIPGFGRDDPRSGLEGWEGIVCSATGLYPPAPFDTYGEPRFSALPMASVFAAAIAAHSVTAALISREETGRGDVVEVPLFDAAFDAIGTYGEEPQSRSQEGLGFEQKRITNPAFVGGRPYRCRDGRYVAHWGLPPKGLNRFWDAHLPAELKDQVDPESAKLATDTLTSLFAQRDAEQWERILQEEYGAAVVTCKSSAEWLEDEHATASHTVVGVEDPILGTTRQPGLAVKLRTTPPAVRFARRVPGEDTEAVKKELESQPNRPRAVAPAITAAGGSALPLAGVRVLDFANILAGPITGRILAEYGAEVIKINKADLGFGIADPYADDGVTFVGHRTTNAGKRSIYLNLKADEGRAILDQLVPSADVVLTNTTPDGAERLGLDEARLKKLNDQLIYASLRLYASGGWRSSYRGHEDLAEDVAGISVRYCGGIPDAMHGVVVNDHATGHFAALGVLLAVFARRRSGAVHGETVEASLSQTATFMQLPYLVGHPGAKWDEPQGPDAWGWSLVDRLYETLDGWIWVTSPGVGGLAKLVGADGLEAATKLVANHSDNETVETELERCFLNRPAHQWETALRVRGIAAHVYRNIATVMRDQIAVSRGLSVTRDHPGLGRGREVGIIRRFASRPDASIAPAVRPGTHTRAVLNELGYGEEEVDRLISRRVVATDDTYRRSGPLDSTGGPTEGK